ncbi:MAG: recombinase family protein [Gemmataceae bacterium]|nr:recombinase family protein [Gemmataceae bacterium]
MPEEFRFQDHVRRHEAAGAMRAGKGGVLGDLIGAMKGGRVDWVLVATFDRWGIQSIDEIFRFRDQLREYGVRLYSVGDELDITGQDDLTVMRIAMSAIQSTGYTKQMADKNIQKMILMAEQAWFASGNAPYAFDHVMYYLHDLSRPIWRVVREDYQPMRCRVLHYTPDSRVERDAGGLIVRSDLRVEREEVLDGMPPRDKKRTGYRLEPTSDARKVEAVRMAFDLADRGYSLSRTADALFDQGHRHYGKRWGARTLEGVFTNPAYIGFPAWSKNGTGKYKQTSGKRAVAVERKATDRVSRRKDRAEWVSSNYAICPPMVDPEAWERVAAGIWARRASNTQSGPVRKRNKLAHPLNGKVFCPDCDKPMVLGSSYPGVKTQAATGRQAKRTHCFHCGTYKRTNRTDCNSNAVSWTKLDRALEQVLKLIGERLGEIGTADVGKLREAEWLKATELGRVLQGMAWAVEEPTGDEDPDGPATGLIEDFQKRERQKRAAGISTDQVNYDARQEVADVAYSVAGDVGYLDKPDAYDLLAETVKRYEAKFQGDTLAIRTELEEIDRDIHDLTLSLKALVRTPTAYKITLGRIEQLESRKRELEPNAVPASVTAEGLRDHLAGIRQVIADADKLKLATLFDRYIEKVVPEFRVVGKPGGKRRPRTEVVALRFVPKGGFNDGKEMEVRISPTACPGSG